VSDEAQPAYLIERVGDRPVTRSGGVWRTMAVMRRPAAASCDEEGGAVAGDLSAVGAEA